MIFQSLRFGNFDNKEDLVKYPRNLDRDQDFLEKLVTKPLVIFAPEVKEVYSGEIESEKFDFQGLDTEMEGKFRPGHFDGVATIVSSGPTIDH